MTWAKQWITKRTIYLRLCTVFSCAALAKDKIVRSEEATKRTETDRIHSPRLKIDQHSSGNILVCTNLIVIDRDVLKLEIVGAFVKTITLDTVLVRNDFLEFST
jgi:hypothetical protein